MSRRDVVRRRWIGSRKTMAGMEMLCRGPFEKTNPILGARAPVHASRKLMAARELTSGKLSEKTNPIRPNVPELHGLIEAAPAWNKPISPIIPMLPISPIQIVPRK